MKQMLTFHPSTIASTASKMNVDAFDVSVDAFDKKEYMQTFNALLDYVNPEIRTKFGNKEGTEFQIPHGSIMVFLKIENDILKMTAPFLNVPEKGKIPLLRQIAGLNFNGMDLAQIVLKDNQLSFEYSCPMALVEPFKLYYILEEICATGDKYDDEFSTKFGATRLYEPQVTPYNEELLNQVYGVIQQTCTECLEAIKYFESNRKFGNAWNILACTLYKILYYAHPQGQLLNDLNKAVREHDRNDIPLPEIDMQTKKFVEKLQAITKEQLAEDLYFVETFIPAKRRSNLKNIQENFEDDYKKAGSYLDQDDHMACSMIITYNFYHMYHYNNLQDDVNDVIVWAMKKASALPWEEAAPILYNAMEKIMNDDLTIDDDEEENTGFDMSSYMEAIQNAGANMQQMTQNIQNMMSSMFGGKNKNKK